MAPQYPHWSKSAQNWYRIDSNGKRRFASKADSVNAEGSSFTSGSPSRSNVAAITTGIETVSLSSDHSPFKVRDPEFYRRGRLFATPRLSPQARESHSGHTVVSTLEIPPERDAASGYAGGGQRYVVVGEDAHDAPGYCYVLLISTYGGLGVARENVIKADHGIIYSGKKREVRPEEDEEPSRREQAMCSTPVRVEMRLPSEKLDPMSRINYRNISRFNKADAVHDLGTVHKDSMPWFLGQFSSVQNRYKPPKDRAIAEPRASGRRRADDGEREEEQESSEDEDSEDDQPSRNQSSSRGSLSMAAEAQKAKDAYHRLIRTGKTHDQAILLIAQTLQQTHSITSMDEAVFAAKGRLRYGDNPIRC